MILYYHFYYEVLYGGILIPAGIYKIFVGATGNGNELIPVGVILTFLHLITEYFRFKFGNNGNINESFPELMAFLIQSILFNFAFVFVPLLNPH